MFYFECIRGVMKGSGKESAIIQELLARHGIDTYIAEAIPEGKSLPGEMSSMSGVVMTPTSAYDFWFDWENGAYTLGEEDGYWEELSVDASACDANYIRKNQARLQETAS